jgi:hypothetical protein
MSQDASLKWSLKNSGQPFLMRIKFHSRTVKTCVSTGPKVWLVRWTVSLLAEQKSLKCTSSHPVTVSQLQHTECLTDSMSDTRCYHSKNIQGRPSNCQMFFCNLWRYWTPPHFITIDTDTSVVGEAYESTFIQGRPLSLTLFYILWR